MGFFNLPQSILDKAKSILEQTVVDEDPDQKRTKKRKDLQDDDPNPPEIIIDPEVPNTNISNSSIQS